jgi:hypothetical protein
LQKNIPPYKTVYLESFKAPVYGGHFGFLFAVSEEDAEAGPSSILWALAYSYEEAAASLGTTRGKRSDTWYYYWRPRIKITVWPQTFAILLSRLGCAKLHVHTVLLILSRQYHTTNDVEANAEEAEGGRICRMVKASVGFMEGAAPTLACKIRFP